MNSCLTRLKCGDVIHYLMMEEADRFYPGNIIFDCYLDAEMQYVIDKEYGRCYYLRHMLITRITKKK